MNNFICTYQKLACLYSPGAEAEYTSDCNQGCDYLEAIEATESPTPSGQMDLLVKPFDEEKYLNKLWECYRNGVDNEGHPRKILFTALIADLLKQVRGEKRFKSKQA